MKLDVIWRPQSARGLSRLSFEQRTAIEHAIDKLRIIPNEGERVIDVCCDFREIVAGGYHIFYLANPDNIEVTGLCRL